MTLFFIAFCIFLFCSRYGIITSNFTCSSEYAAAMFAAAGADLQSAPLSFGSVIRFKCLGE